MTPERWKRLDRLLDEALDQPPENRASFAAQACAGDSELKAHLEELLEAHAAAGSRFLADPAANVAAAAAAAGRAQLLAGRRIGPYNLLAPLGRGGMGEVYLAEDEKLGRKVAIKLLPAVFSADSGRLRRFVGEARATSALNHPNILTIYDAGEFENEHYIVMEFVEGKTVRSLVQQGRPPVADSVNIAIQACSALEAAHAAGFVHRDIKPENIMVRPDGLVKVLDFGLAKQYETNADSGTITLTGQFVIGTPQYMSPEQARGLRLDHRADLFSLGVVLYELLAGKPPFAGETVSDRLAAVITAEPTPVGALAAVPPALERVVAKALRKDREERYQSAAEFAAALRSVVLETAPESSETAGRGRRADAATQVASVAVLPFANLTGDPGFEYLAEGVAESLIQRLAELPSLRVTARSVSFRFKSPDLDPQQTGRALGVSAVFLGRVLRAGNQISIRTELVHVDDGAQLWGASFDAPFSEIFEIQQNIARSIAQKLRVKLSQGQRLKLAKRYTTYSEAYDLYLRGRYAWNQRTPGSLKQSIEMYERAIEKDAGYALAYAGLADCYGLLAYLSLAPPAVPLARAKAAALKAVELDGSLSEAHDALGFVLHRQWDFRTGERELKRALKLNPRNASARHRYGLYLLTLGLGEAGVAAIREAQQLDPGVPIFNAHVGFALYLSGRFEEAVAHLKRLMEVAPGFYMGRVYLANSLMASGRLEEAIETYGGADAARQMPIYLAALGYTYAAAGKRERAQAILDEVLAIEQKVYFSPYMLALFYAGLGDADRSFAWLEKAYEARDEWMVFMELDWMWNPLRSDERFPRMIARTKAEWLREK